ncbi:hypothetical protein P8610_18095 [Fictibacillus sp. UD]|uniref:hypothetical protein n=1 Tax=Fictibacillus sp. UD TaxID=3038777 RepID=UPI0037464116
MANKLVFRKFVEAREHIEAIQRCKEFYGEDDSLEKKQLSALKEIFDYIKNDETWVGQEKSRKKAILFIKNRCNYGKTKDELGAKSKNSVEASMSYLSKKLEGKVGASTIELILEGKVDEAMIQFRAGTGKLNPSDFIIDGLLNLLPLSNKLHANLEECKKEIKFLLTLTKANLEKHTNLYNKHNLSYLLFVLTSTDSVVAHERKVLYQLLRGDFSKNANGDSLDLNSQITKAFENF